MRGATSSDCFFHFAQPSRIGLVAWTAHSAQALELPYSPAPTLNTSPTHLHHPQHKPYSPTPPSTYKPYSPTPHSSIPLNTTRGDLLGDPYSLPNYLCLVCASCSACGTAKVMYSPLTLNPVKCSLSSRQNQSSPSTDAWSHLQSK